MDRGVKPSLVMNEMNSLTHSCIHSFASLAILAFSGRAVFIILATGAKFLMLESSSRPLEVFEALDGEVAGGDGDKEPWDMIGHMTAQ